MNKTIAVHAHFVTYASIDNEDDFSFTEYQPSNFIDRIRDFFIKRAVQNQIYGNSGVKSDKKDLITSDKTIDITRLNNDIGLEIEQLNNLGYEVVSITPITSGEYKYDYEAPMINARDRPSYGWGYGFSYTCGVIITARKTISGVK